MSNSQGSYRISDRAIWRAFDQLPASVRERLSQCNCDWVPTFLARDWNAGRTSATELIKLIDEWDQEDKAEHFARLQRMADTGRDYKAQLTQKSFKKYSKVN